MANLAAISTATTAASALGSLILASPQATVGYQPQNGPVNDGSTNPLPPSFLFNYEGEQSVLIESDITDHAAEDNSSLQDNIALRPVMINTNGFIGELTDIAPSPLAALQSLADKLTVLGAYTPVISATALIAYNEAFFAYQLATTAVNAAVSAWSSVAGGGSSSQNVIGSNGITVGSNQTKQAAFFAQFYGYWNSRTLFTVQTPWGVFQDCAIKSVRPVQDATTQEFSTFEVSFKQMRFANSITNSVPLTSYQGRAANSAAGITNLGTQTLTPASSSFSSELAGVA